MGISVRIDRAVVAHFRQGSGGRRPCHIGRKTASAQEPVHAIERFDAIQVKITRTTLAQKTKGDGFQIDALERLFQRGFDQSHVDPATPEITPKGGVPRRPKPEPFSNKAGGEIGIVDQTDTFECFDRIRDDRFPEPPVTEFADDLRPGIGAAFQELERRFFRLFDVGVQFEQTGPCLNAFDQLGSAARRSGDTVSGDSVSPLSSSSVGRPIAILTSFSIF